VAEDQRQGVSDSYGVRHTSTVSTHRLTSVSTGRALRSVLGSPIFPSGTDTKIRSGWRGRCVEPPDASGSVRLYVKIETDRGADSIQFDRS